MLATCRRTGYAGSSVPTIDFSSSPRGIGGAILLPSGERSLRVPKPALGTKKYVSQSACSISAQQEPHNETVVIDRPSSVR
jgi:hypothetical protein